MTKAAKMMKTTHTDTINAAYKEYDWRERELKMQEIRDSWLVNSSLHRKSSKSY